MDELVAGALFGILLVAAWFAGWRFMPQRPRRQLDYQQGWDDGYRAGTMHEREADMPVPRLGPPAWRQPDDHAD